MFISVEAFTQNSKIVDAYSSLNRANDAKGDNITKELLEAKQYIDEAYNFPGTSDSPKMWNYRAKIYLKIAVMKDQKLDKDAVIKATEAHLKCLQVKDPTKKRPKIIVQKWTPKEDVISGLVSCGYALYNEGYKSFELKEYDRAIKLYDMISSIFPYDENNQLERGSINKQTVLFNIFLVARKNKDIAKSKEVLQELIDLQYNEPKIYIYMSNIYQEEGNMDMALKYLSMGREVFEDNQSILMEEVNLYIQLGRTDELIEKLTEAITLDEYNDVLYFNRATIYDGKGEMDNAVADYKSALDINPDNFSANYNLGVLYFNQAVQLAKKSRKELDDDKAKEQKKKSSIYLDKALPSFLIAFEINKEHMGTLKALKELYYLKDDASKEKEMKDLIDALK